MLSKTVSFNSTAFFRQIIHLRIITSILIHMDRNTHNCYCGNRFFFWKWECVIVFDWMREPHPVSLCRTTDWPNACFLFDYWLREETRFLFGLYFSECKFVVMSMRCSFLNIVWVKSKCQRSFISVTLHTISHVYFKYHKNHFLVWYHWWNPAYCPYKTSYHPSSQQSGFIFALFLNG